MSYPSRFNGTEPEGKTLVGCGVYPVAFRAKGAAAGPAPKLTPEEAEEQRDATGEDIVDETLYYFKTRMALKTYPLDGAADRVTLYLTMYTQLCLKRLAAATARGPLSPADATQLMGTLAAERFPIPGEAGFPFAPLYPKAEADGEALQEYLRQLRLELGHRLVERVYAFPDKATGQGNKFWLLYGKQKFLGYAFEKPSA